MARKTTQKSLKKRQKSWKNDENWLKIAIKWGLGSARSPWEGSWRHFGSQKRPRDEKYTKRQHRYLSLGPLLEAKIYFFSSKNVSKIRHVFEWVLRAQIIPKWSQNSSKIAPKSRKSGWKRHLRVLYSFRLISSWNSMTWTLQNHAFYMGGPSKTKEIACSEKNRK